MKHKGRCSLLLSEPSGEPAEAYSAGPRAIGVGGPVLKSKSLHDQRQNLSPGTSGIRCGEESYFLTLERPEIIQVSRLRRYPSGAVTYGLMGCGSFKHGPKVFDSPSIETGSMSPPLECGWAVTASLMEYRDSVPYAI